MEKSFPHDGDSLEDHLDQIIMSSMCIPTILTEILKSATKVLSSEDRVQLEEGVRMRVLIDYFRNLCFGMNKTIEVFESEEFKQTLKIGRALNGGEGTRNKPYNFRNSMKYGVIKYVLQIKTGDSVKTKRYFSFT